MSSSLMKSIFAGDGAAIDSIIQRKQLVRDSTNGANMLMPINADEVGKHAVVSSVNMRMDWAQKLSMVGMSGYLWYIVNYEWENFPNVPNVTVDQFLADPTALDYKGKVQPTKELLENYAAAKLFMTRMRIPVALFLRHALQFDPGFDIESVFKPAFVKNKTAQRNDSRTAKLGVLSSLAGDEDVAKYLETVADDSLPANNYTLDTMTVKASAFGIKRDDDQLVIKFKVPSEQPSPVPSLTPAEAHVLAGPVVDTMPLELRGLRMEQSSVEVAQSLTSHMLNDDPTMTDEQYGAKYAEYIQSWADSYRKSNFAKVVGVRENVDFDSLEWLMKAQKRSAALYKFIPSVGKLNGFASYMTEKFDEISIATESIYGVQKNAGTYVDQLLAVHGIFDTQKDAEQYLEQNNVKRINVRIVPTGCCVTMMPTCETREAAIVNLGDETFIRQKMEKINEDNTCMQKMLKQRSTISARSNRFTGSNAEHAKVPEAIIEYVEGERDNMVAGNNEDDILTKRYNALVSGGVDEVLHANASAEYDMLARTVVGRDSTVAQRAQEAQDNGDKYVKPRPVNDEEIVKDLEEGEMAIPIVDVQTGEVVNIIGSRAMNESEIPPTK